ncbi:MAG: hypothetical protein P9L99_01725 [Candidatus Lernaella stagnicola]|nr:hypothetical protein [Candidatus Lernaella stagnicola]
MGHPIAAKPNAAVPCLLRLSVYVALLFPIAYVMGIADAARRLHYYLRIVYFFAPLLALVATHYVLLRKRPAYRAWWEQPRPRTALLVRLAVGLVFLAWLAAPSLMLTIIGYGLQRIAFYILAVGLAGWWIAQWRLRERWPRCVRLDIPLLLLIPTYFGIASIGLTYFGSGDRACQTVAQSPFLTPIISREDIARSGAVDSCFPYDVKSDPVADRLFFTLKQRRSGFLRSWSKKQPANDAVGVTSFSAPDFASARLATVIGEAGGSYPQRITVDPRRKEIHVVVLDRGGAHSVRTYDYTDDTLREVRRLDLDYEPIRVYVDSAKDELIVLGYGGAVGVFPRDGKQPRLFREYDDLGFIGMFDTLVPNRDGSGYFASMVASDVLLLDADDFTIRKRGSVGAPTIGMDYDPAGNRLYAAGTLTREIIVLDGDSLAVLDRIPTETTVRELYLDHRRGLIVTAGYVDGMLDFYDLHDRTRRARLFVGKLARGLHLEPTSGRLFAASSCGLFEVDVDALLARGEPKP